MKKLRLLVALVAVFTVLTLTGCGKDLSKYAGTYKGEYTKMVGDSEKDTADTFSLELKADGTGTSSRDGATYDITWSVDGEKFTMTEKFMGLKVEYNGTIKDDKIDVFNGDKDDDFTFEYVYSKE